MRRQFRFRLMLLFFTALISFSFTACKNSSSSASASNKSYSYVASSNSDKYHKPSCEWALKIKSSNLIKFASKEEAEKNGYVPCKVCKP